MTLFLTADAFGKLSDSATDADIAAAMTPEPAVTDVILSAHGWQTSFDESCADYNRFACGILSHIGRSATRLSVNLHWPSTLADTFKPASIVDVATFYVMERRADIVGENAMASAIRSVIRNQRVPLTLTLIGHSFGCKVVCAALQQLAHEGFDFGQVTIKAILLQAAFESDALEPGKQYGDVLKLPARILATKSTLDTALCTWFKVAATVDPLKVFAKGERTALGAVGPTPAAQQAYGLDRLVVADLTPVHESRKAMFKGPSGSHSDMANEPVFDLVARF